MARKNTSQDKEKLSAPEAAPYTVLARRYRPHTFADLVGQEPVSRALSNAIQSGRVAHAYLFTGARGVGKTSTARILARALNCVKGPTATPCGECEICVSIASGEDQDVLEIDAASNRGIDNVRDIRGNVQYRPSRARYKIYIIDEVHMLTKESFNALLKTLEEPPPHVKFIFATTEVDKIPITILSRCQRFDFAGISLPRIVERLRLITEREGVQATPEALELVARRAGGSMRDAQSLLDQLLAFGGDQLTADQVHHLLGTAGDERVLALADAVLTRDAKKALELLDEACVGGLQLGELIDQLIAYWRDLMIVQQAGTEGRDLSVPARHHETLRRHSKAASVDAVLAGLDVLAATRTRLRGSNHGRTLLEMALVRLTRLADLASLTQLSQLLAQGRVAPITAGATGPATLASRAAAADSVKKNDLTAPPEPVQTGARELNATTLPQIWREACAKLGVMHAAELGRGRAPAISGPNALVLRFPSDYNTSRVYCEQADRLSKLEAALKLLTGQTWSVKIEEEKSSTSNGTVPVAETPKPKRTPKEEAEKIPLVKRAIELFGATITRTDDNFGEAAPGDRAPNTEED